MTNPNESDAIKAVIDQLMDAYNKGDVDGVAELYSQDALILPPHSPAVSGTKAIRELWTGAMDMGIREMHFTVLEIEQYEGVAVMTGSYTLTGENGMKIDRGKFMASLKPENSRWKLHRDIWNTDMPLQPE